MERHHNAGLKNTRIIGWLISLVVLVASPNLVQAALTCSQCHGGGDGSAVKDSPTATRDAAGNFKGNHGTHLPTVTTVGQCIVCHGAQVATYGSDHSARNKNQIQMSPNIDGYTGLSGPAAYNKSLFWNLTSVPVLTTCSNVNCHFERNTPTWGATAYNSKVQCSECHSAAPATFAHAKHFSAYSTVANGRLGSCGQCHTNYIATVGRSSFQHATSAGRPIMINASLGYTGSNNRYLPGQATGRQVGTCSTLICHSSGKIASPVSWSATGTGCNLCHPMANLSNTHAKHTGLINLATTRSYANYTANISTGNGGNYGFGCTTCHPTAVSSHINGNIEVTFASDPAAGSMRARNVGATINGTVGTGVVTCTATYCHGSGLANSGTTPQWNTPFTGDRCNKCHGNSPTTGAHDAHKVGIHYDNIFSGKTGFLGYSSTGNVAHGIATQATTISCNICHIKTVSTAYNKLGTTCTSCHASDAGTLVLDAPNALGFHVNGKVDVSFNTTPIRSKAQIRDTSFALYSGLWTRNGGAANYKKDATSYDIAKVPLNDTMWTAGLPGQGSCSNIVCHNLRPGQPAVIWNQTLNCVDCHSQL